MKTNIYNHFNPKLEVENVFMALKTSICDVTKDKDIGFFGFFILT